MRNKDQFRGCLVGGAVGDALGYAVEFLDEQEIFDRYGKNGITAYTLWNVPEVPRQNVKFLWNPAALNTICIGSETPISNGIGHRLKRIPWNR